jgi:hypothetical protein
MTKFVCFLMGLPAWWLKGYVLATLWTWFLVPVGVPRIGIAAALGIGTLLSLSRSSTSAVMKEVSETTERDNKYWINSMLTSWLIPLIALGFGRVYLYLSTF